MLVYSKLHEKIMWLRVNDMDEKNTRWLIIIKHKQSARIKCKNNLFKSCVQSKQPRTIKTIICNDIFTSSRRKKVQSPAKQFKKLFSLFESLSMKWNRRFWGLTMFVCNFGVGSLEQSVKLGRLSVFDFLGNSLL